MYSLSTGGLINSHSPSVGEPTFTRTKEKHFYCVEGTARYTISASEVPKGI